MAHSIDLAFRPKTYFRPQRLERYLLSRVKGAALRATLNALIQSGHDAEVKALLETRGISKTDRKVLESIHPMYMGGNYLPDTEESEVEIARIRISSTTFDVTSVYARRNAGAIHYRVVDEYEGETLSGQTEIASSQPMSLEELHEFFTGAWPLHAVLEMNFEGDLEGMLGFFKAESDFYPEFDALCRRKVIEKYRADDEPE